MKNFFKFLLSHIMNVSYSPDNTHIIYSNKWFKIKCSRNYYNKYKSKNDEEKIKKYLKYKLTRKAKGVVYTCITNDYDDINEIKTYKYIDEDWDYVLFTDNEEQIKQGQIGIWEVRPLQFNELDNTRNQRWHKINPHLLFPEYNKSIWIDGNINILTDYIFKQAYKMKSNIKIPKHFKNKCIYDEYADVKNFTLDQDDLIDKELLILKQAGMPKNYGFTETNILIRNHNLPEIVKIQNEWWYFITNYSKRDQLSCMFILWKFGIKTDDIILKNTRLDTKDFYSMIHKKVRDKEIK